MQENPEHQEKMEPKESEFTAPGEIETGYTEKSWEKPETAMEETTIEPTSQERIEPKTSEFTPAGEIEAGYTEKSWEKPEKTMEEKGTGHKKEKRLTKSKSNRMLFGVCGGLGEYFGVDPTLVRLVFVLLALLDGIGIVIYIILAVIMPKEDSD
jgi:phage shock protein C